MSKALVRKKSNVSATYLERLEQSEPRREGAPSELALSDIQVAGKVFQWRLPDEDVLADTRFVQELVDALEVQEEPRSPFEPLLVLPIGQQFYLVDGHHRLDAYATFGWQGTVPVEVFPGNLQDAILEAWKRNAHNKLPMTKASRFEAAWKMVKAGKLSRAEITRRTSVRRSTLTNMRSVLAEFGKRASVRTWAEARRLRRDQDAPSGDDWKEAAAREIALQLAKGPKQTTDPELLAMALAMAKEGLPAQLTTEWLGEVVQDVLLKAAEDGGSPELQDDIDKVFKALFPGPSRGFGEDLEASPPLPAAASEGPSEA
jgi:ParB-like chromosome segregation protein Spo0J